MLLISVFLFSRLLYWQMGIRFYGTTIDWYFQYLDLPILQSELIEGCYYLHSQPPLFNVFLGIILKVFPNCSQQAFQVCFMICGFVLYWAMFKSLTHLTSFKTAIIGSTVFIISPQVIIYENWLFYPYPVCTLLVIALYCLVKYNVTQRTIFIVSFFTIIGCICLIRSSFHLAYFLGCMLIMYKIIVAKRQSVGYICLVIITIILSLYIKNAVLFGVFGSSSLMGMNLWKIAGKYISKEELEQVKGSEKIPLFVSLKSPFQESDGLYPKEFWRVPSPFDEIGALKEKAKISGAKNFNYYGYIDISRGYMEASRVVIMKFPYKYVAGVVSAWILYLEPSIEYPHMKENLERIEPLLRWRRMAYQHSMIKLDSVFKDAFGVVSDVPFKISTIPLVMLGSILCAGIWLIRTKTSYYGKGAIGFCVFSILYVAVLGNAVELGENFRFRFETNALYYIVFVSASHRLFAQREVLLPG